MNRSKQISDIASRNGINSEELTKIIRNFSTEFAAQYYYFMTNNILTDKVNIDTYKDVKFIYDKLNKL